jgi:hypothetical protein
MLYHDTVFAAVRIDDGRQGYILFNAISRDLIVRGDSEKKRDQKRDEEMLKNLQAAVYFQKICDSNFSKLYMGMSKGDVRKITCAEGFCCAKNAYYHYTIRNA